MLFNRLIAFIMAFLYGATFYRVYFGRDQRYAKVYRVKRMIPKWAAGQTIGDVIFLREPFLEDQRILKQIFGRRSVVTEFKQVAEKLLSVIFYQSAECRSIPLFAS